MKPLSKKIVSQTPLKQLWTDTEILSASRKSYLSRSTLKELIGRQPVRFVIASIGSKLTWVDEAACYDLWTSEVEKRVPEEEEFSLEDYPGHYVYVPSLWTDEQGTSLILLEVHH